jgi:hypothetical protein
MLCKMAQFRRSLGSRLAKQSLPNLTSAVHLVLNPEAQAEILEAADWYDLQDAGLGDEFLKSTPRYFSFFQAPTSGQRGPLLAHDGHPFSATCSSDSVSLRSHSNGLRTTSLSWLSLRVDERHSTGSGEASNYL